MKKSSHLAMALGVLIAVPSVNAQFSLAPLVGFGGVDGWLAPGEGSYAYLGTANLERGLAFGNAHLYLVTRTGTNNIRILDKLTGVDLGSLNNSGISGGTFPVNT